ncbi:unnamed protein product [Prunus armeniaca]
MIQTDRLYSADDLYTIRQRKDEPLWEYTTRFSHEYSRCPETDDRAAFGALKSGLRSSHFRYLVHSINWRTYDELMKQAAVHTKAEYFNSKPGPSAWKEESATKSYQGRTNDSSAGHKRKNDRDSRQGNSKKGRRKYGRNDHRAPLPNHDRAQEVFTLLNTTYETVLMNEHDQIPKLTNRKPNRQDNRDTGKFCRYHQQNSHNTEDCISLRKIVERLIREGKLDHYIARSPQASAPNANRQINMISTISGGPTLEGPSNRSMKQYVRAAHNPQVPKVGWEPITFCEEEEEGIVYPHDDPMIIRAEIADYDIGRVMIDTGSSANHGQLANNAPPQFFWGSGLASRHYQFAHRLRCRPQENNDPTTYNIIIGRTALTRVKAHLSPHMLLMKFLTRNGTGVIRGDQLSARTCYATALKSVACKPPMEAMTVQGLPNGSGPIDDPREETPTPVAQPAEELETVVLNKDFPDRSVKIGTNLDPDLRRRFIDFLRQQAEVFAWSYDDMPGISPDVISHKLSISTAHKPVRQKRCSYDAERYEAMRAEVDKLYQGSYVPCLACQLSHGSEDHRTMADVSGLYRPKQGLSEGQFSLAENRPARRRYH